MLSRALALLALLTCALVQASPAANGSALRGESTAGAATGSFEGAHVERAPYDAARTAFDGLSELGEAEDDDDRPRESAARIGRAGADRTPAGTLLVVDTRSAVPGLVGPRDARGPPVGCI